MLNKSDEIKSNTFDLIVKKDLILIKLVMQEYAKLIDIVNKGILSHSQRI